MGGCLSSTWQPANLDEHARPPARTFRSRPPGGHVDLDERVARQVRHADAGPRRQAMLREIGHNAIFAISAVAVVAMPTGILAAAFSDAFQRGRENRDGEE